MTGIEFTIRGIDVNIDLCNWRETWRPSLGATGHQRSIFLPLPFDRTLAIFAYSWDHFKYVETDPLITGPIECARCEEAFDTVTERTMHVIRKRCPEVETDADVDALDSVHALGDVFR